MKTEHILFIVVAGFFCAFLIFLVYLYKPNIPIKFNQAATSSTDVLNSLNSRVKSLAEETTSLSTKLNNQSSDIQDLKTFVSTQSAQPTIVPNNKSILNIASTKSGLYSTTSVTYSPMGMYVNIKCPKNCYLWINFYSSSKNLGTPAIAQGNVNTYAIFLNESDQSIYSQASFPVAVSAIPVSLNAVIPVGTGVHTIDIRAKTSAGTLQSDSSALQVLAIER